MDKKEMQNWIDYLNNGGNALDMFDELERNAEEKIREKEGFRLTLKKAVSGLRMFRWNTEIRKHILSHLAWQKMYSRKGMWQK